MLIKNRLQRYIILLTERFFGTNKTLTVIYI